MENEERAALRRDTGLDHDHPLHSHKALLQRGNRERGPPKGPAAPAENSDDSDPSSGPNTPRRRPSPLTRRKRLSSEEEEDKSMTAFTKILAMAFGQHKKDDDDSGKRIPLKAPESFDKSFAKLRRLWE